MVGLIAELFQSFCCPSSTRKTSLCTLSPIYYLYARNSSMRLVEVLVTTSSTKSTVGCSGGLPDHTLFPYSSWILICSYFLPSIILVDDRRARAVWGWAAGGVHEKEQRIAYVAQPIVAAYRLQQEECLSWQFNRPCEFDKNCRGYRDYVSPNHFSRTGFGLITVPVSQDLVHGRIILVHFIFEAGCRTVEIKNPNLVRV